MAHEGLFSQSKLANTFKFTVLLCTSKRDEIIFLAIINIVRVYRLYVFKCLNTVYKLLSATQKPFQLSLELNLPQGPQY